jgi:hypothetical protein
MNQNYPGQNNQNQNHPGYPPGTPGGYGAPPPGSMYPHSPYPNYMPTPSGSFIEHLHTQGRSGLFLTGIILFSAGTLFTIFASFSALSIISLLLAALPITGFWLIFAASKSPRLPEKTLPALTLFKIYTIFWLVVVGLVALAFLIFFGLAFIGLAEFGGGGELAVLLIMFFLTAVVFAVIIAFYYVPILRIIGSIRRNILHNAMEPLRGVLPFTVVAIILVSLGILGALVGLAVMGTMGVMLDMFIDDIMWEIMRYAPELRGLGLQNMLQGFMTSITLTFLFSLLIYVGTILLVVSLNKLSGVVRR